MRSARQLRKTDIEGVDGSLGMVSDLFFDSQTWAIRYVVVDTGKWLPGRRVLISPGALAAEQSNPSVVRLTLTREQIEHSPDVSLDQPISRQIESLLFSYYGWPDYWSPGLVQEAPVPPAPPLPETAPNPHLRSMNDVVGYHVQALDGEIGHIDDFIIDDAARNVRLIVVDTRNWLPGRKVRIPLRWVDEVDWQERRVRLLVPRQEVKDSPEHDPSEVLTS